MEMNISKKVKSKPCRSFGFSFGLDHGHGQAFPNLNRLVNPKCLKLQNQSGYRRYIKRVRDKLLSLGLVVLVSPVLFLIMLDTYLEKTLGKPKEAGV